MILKDAEAERFYRIWWPLLKYVNTKRRIVPDLAARPGDGALKVEPASQLRDALWRDESLLDQFIKDNPAELRDADLVLVSSWRNRVVGKFFVLKYLKRHTVFIETSTSRVYGVLGLYSPIDELMNARPPQFTDATLLPFEGQIVIDGLVTRHGISFGAGIRRGLEATYREAKGSGRIITSLPTVNDEDG